MCIICAKIEAISIIKKKALRECKPATLSFPMTKIVLEVINLGSWLRSGKSWIRSDKYWSFADDIGI